MDISSASSVNALSGQAVGESVGTSIQKKAMDLDKQNMAAVLGTVQPPAKPSTSNLPPNLGQNVNTKA
jgi:Putative motility protein